MFDPNQHAELCERYLSRYLAVPVTFLRAIQLAQSTRAAPWRLDVMIDGKERSFVLQLDARGMENEYTVLKALENHPIPTPRVYGLDMSGEALGMPCFFSDFITGEPLLTAMLAGEPWAETLYLNAVCALQSVSAADLVEVYSNVEQESAEDVLEDAWAYFKDHPRSLAESAYQRLCATKPKFPPLYFSNGDLWLENFLVREKQWAGVIDFQHAAFSDPVFEFLLSFFVEPRLQGRGIEVRYCQRIGVDPASLHWYHGLEFFDTLRWVLLTGESFVHHTVESLETDIKMWLE